METPLQKLVMIGTYLEVEGRLGAALVGLLGGDMDFKIVDGFVMALETGFICARECEWLEGGGECEWLGGQGAERTDGFKQVLPSDVDTLN